MNASAEIRQEQLTVGNTAQGSNHSDDQGPSEEKDDMEAAAYEELRQSAFKALQCIEEDFAKLRERYILVIVDDNVATVQ